jgi:salicylate hydroxylase
MRERIGIMLRVQPSTPCCYRCIISASKLRELGLKANLNNYAIEFWDGDGIDKLVLPSCGDNDVVSCYCFYLVSKNDLRERWMGHFDHG